MSFFPNYFSMLEHESFTQLSQLLWGQLGQLSKQKKKYWGTNRVEIEILKNQSICMKDAGCSTCLQLLFYMPIFWDRFCELSPSCTIVFVFLRKLFAQNYVLNSHP